MNAFQIVFLIGCGAQAVVALRRFARSRHAGALLFGAVWVGAMIVIARPGLSTRLANAVGIGRGVDLVIYAFLAIFVWAHYQQFLRYKRLESYVTQLVRELAIQQAGRSSGRGVPSS